MIDTWALQSSLAIAGHLQFSHAIMSSSMDEKCDRQPVKWKRVLGVYGSNGVFSYAGHSSTLLGSITRIGKLFVAVSKGVET